MPEPTPNVPLQAPRPRDAALFGFGLTLAVILFGGVLGLVNVGRLAYHNDRVAHTHEVLRRVEALVSTLKDAETGQRGFLIVGDEEYLQPYHDAVAGLATQLARLKELTSDNPLQRDRIAGLEGKVAARMNVIRRTVELAKGGDRDAAIAVVRDHSGKALMDAIREDVSVMRRVEEGLLRERAEVSESSRRASVASIVSSAVIGVGLVGLVFALSGRKLAAEQKAARDLAEQAGRLRTTLSSIGDAVITTDTQGRITNMNAVAESLTGWSNDDAAGRPLSDVFRIINEEDRGTVESPATRALREGVVVGLANHTLLIAKDGAERPIDDSAAPIRCGVGEVLGCVLVFRDVTERREAEIRLAKSEGRLRFVMESMPQKIFTAKPDGAVDDFNHAWAEYLGLPAEDVLGWGWSRSLHPDDLEQTFRAWKESISTGAPFEMEHRFRRADGQYRWHLSKVVALRGGNGKIIMWVGSNTDVHEQRLAADELRQLSADLSEADRRKDEFLATLAHELRNPLAPIRNGLQIMRLAGGGGEEFAGAVEDARAMMERQLTQMVRLVDDLLDLSRISRGKLELRKERVELQAAIASAVETSRPLVDAGGHELTVELPPEPVLVDADLTRLAQVFANLLNNAAKYSDRGGRVRLVAAVEGGEVVVTVSDSGVGIPPEMLPKIFDMFTQVDRSLERSQGGLGIGLTLVKRLVDMHGGSVEVRSEGHGKGSAFVVRLPVASSSTRKSGPTSGGAPAGVGHGAAPRFRVLIADDNADAAASLARLLKLMGHEAVTANNGLAAVELASRFRPEVAFLDIGMPGLNGYEACRRLRKLPSGGSAVLIALTGWGQDEDRRRSEEAGFDYHLVKPVDPEGLESLLAGLPAASA